MTTETERGQLGVTWKNEHKLLPYIRPEMSTYQKAEYEKAGYRVNHMINFNVEEYRDSILPLWATTIDKIFGLYDQTLKFIRVSQYDVIPPYYISTTEYCDKYKGDPDTLMNSLLMLEDWQPGQLLEVGGVPHTNWKQGQWFKFKCDRTISYANVGKKKMYMIEVLGKECYTGQLEHLFPLNVPNVYEKPEASHPFVQTSIIPYINPHNDSQRMNLVFMHNGYIKELDDIKHDDKGRQKINNFGITVWLFEPMCCYYDGEEFTQGFYSEFSYPTDTKRMRSKELDSVLAYLIRNKIDPFMVKVASGEYGIKEGFPFYTQALELECDDLYVRTQRPIIGLDALINDNYIKHDFSKHFISLNWRFTKHRQLIANFLAGENGYLSWYFNDTIDVVKDKLYFDIEEWKDASPVVYKQLHDNNLICQQNAPYIVDKPSDIGIDSQTAIWPSVAEYKDGQTPSLFNTKETMLANFYRDIFVDIVTETRFAQSCANYSEKVLQPMQYMKPFILLAPPHTLKYLKESGYQTFSEFWDESYDSTEDHGERLRKILELIKSLLDKPIEELRNVYQQMLPVLEHNKKLYKKLTNTPNYTNTEFHD